MLKKGNNNTNHFRKGEEMLSIRKIVIMALMWFCTAHVWAETITIFDSNATISDGNTYDTVVVKGDGTVVDMTGGDVNTVITMDASTFNMSGGDCLNSWIWSHGSSTLNLSSGSVMGINSFGESKINISGDFIISAGDENDIASRFYDSSVVTISSDNVNVVYALVFYNSSTLNLSAGTIYRIETLRLSNGRLNMSGGSVTDLQLSLDGHNTVTISGGTITDLIALNDGSPIEGGEIQIVGYDLMALPYGGGYGAGQITGYWNDDTPFSITIMRSCYDHISLYDGVIPASCADKPSADLTDDCKVNFIDLDRLASEWLDCGLEDPNAC